MSQTVEIKVGKNTFFVTKMNAFEALPVFGDLQKELLPALGALLGSLKDSKQEGSLKDEPEGSLKDVNNADLEKAVEKLSAQLDGKSLERWATRLLDSGHIAYEDENGEAVRFKLARDGHIFQDFAEVKDGTADLVDLLKINAILDMQDEAQTREAERWK